MWMYARLEQSQFKLRAPEAKDVLSVFPRVRIASRSNCTPWLVTVKFRVTAAHEPTLPQSVGGVKLKNEGLLHCISRVARVSPEILKLTHSTSYQRNGCSDISKLVTFRMLNALHYSDLTGLHILRDIRWCSNLEVHQHCRAHEGCTDEQRRGELNKHWTVVGTRRHGTGRDQRCLLSIAIYGDHQGSQGQRGAEACPHPVNIS
jgi:hypothetical protein